MNDSIVDTQTETLKAPIVQEESVDLTRKVRAYLQTAGAVREDLVNDLQAKVKSGTYEVPSEVIAAKMLENFREEGD